MTDAMSRVKAYLYHNILSQHDQDVASIVQELEETRKQLERAESVLKRVVEYEYGDTEEVREYFAAKGKAEG